jgi:hypothetical protein
VRDSGPIHRTGDGDKGLDPDGFLAREGAIERVPAPFVPLVDDVRRRVAKTFGPRLHSAYLYGSLPRGTARPGRSDLDLLIALHPDGPIAADRASSGLPEPVHGDRSAARALASALDAS